MFEFTSTSLLAITLALLTYRIHPLKMRLCILLFVCTTLVSHSYGKLSDVCKRFEKKHFAGKYGCKYFNNLIWPFVNLPACSTNVI